LNLSEKTKGFNVIYDLATSIGVLILSLSIYYFWNEIGFVLGWLISTLIMMLFIQNVPSKWAHHSAIKFGSYMGIYGSWLVVSYFWVYK